MTPDERAACLADAEALDLIMARATQETRG
jgi:hypothetical protein